MTDEIRTVAAEDPSPTLATEIHQDLQDFLGSLDSENTCRV